jgi:hypothetical protein
MQADLEILADLPDGTLTIDVLTGSASHTTIPQLSLYIAGELQAWLTSRMATALIPLQTLNSAVVVTEIRTDRIATNRKRIVSFEFDCRSTLTSGLRTYVGTLVEKHVWHSRIAKK